MSSNLRLTRFPLAALACLALAVAIMAGGSANAQAANCKVPAYPYHGYFTGGTFTATKVSCAYGKKFLLAFQKCRTSSGKHLSARCTRKVQGFSCTEKRNAIPDEIDAKVTCKRGGTQRIVHTYQQNLEE